MQTCYFRRKDTNSFSYLQIFQRKKIEASRLAHLYYK